MIVLSSSSLCTLAEQELLQLHLFSRIIISVAVSHEPDPFLSKVLASLASQKSCFEVVLVATCALTSFAVMIAERLFRNGDCKLFTPKGEFAKSGGVFCAKSGVLFGKLSHCQFLDVDVVELVERRRRIEWLDRLCANLLKESVVFEVVFLCFFSFYLLFCFVLF